MFVWHLLAKGATGSLKDHKSTLIITTGWLCTMLISIRLKHWACVEYWTTTLTIVEIILVGNGKFPVNSDINHQVMWTNTLWFCLSWKLSYHRSSGCRDSYFPFNYKSSCNCVWLEICVYIGYGFVPQGICAKTPKFVLHLVTLNPCTTLIEKKTCTWCIPWIVQ